MNRCQFDTCLRDPVAYLDTTEELRSSSLRGVKLLFEFCKKYAQNSLVPTGPLTELCTDGFCNDGVWEQLELLNEPALRQLTQLINTVGSGGVGDMLCKLRPETSDDAVSNISEDPGGSDGGSCSGVLDDQDDSVADNSCVKGRFVRVRRRGGSGKGGGRRGRSGDGGRRSVVDDQFFRLAEMEEFVERLEAGEEEEEGMFAA